ncbi:amidohydrolase family protein [Devosia sp. 1566]|uniref:amidohydrolase family protein n=1 Tax=Devosia sp. 1566 TaxID=2499144 RepID=UPI000FD8F810|nr:amidohydrolase family protein [Devosia sp. 1566]
MRILDAHQHFWDLDANYLPWLADKPVSFRYGNYDALKRNYMPPDYRRDAEGYELAGSVFIETEWNPEDPMGEVAWVEDLRGREGLPSVMVAQAWLDREDAEQVLGALGQVPFARGIRHKPKAATRPDEVVAGAPGSMGDSAFRRGFAMLAPNGLSFDLQTPWWHLPEAAELARAFPQTQIIINHTGLPSDRSDSGLNGWRAAMREAAGCPNVAVKISGLGQKEQPWTVEVNRPIIRETIEIFGVERCMFASNFPVDSLVASFATIFDGFRQSVADLPAADQELLFCGNAARFYRIDLSEGN